MSFFIFRMNGPYRSRSVPPKKTYNKKRVYTKYKPRPKKLASSRTTYDQTVIEHPSVGIGFGARTRLRTFQHVPIVKSAIGEWLGTLYPGSCFDPMGSTGTRQPNLYDQWKLLFDRYMVLGATVKLVVSTQGVVAANVINDSNEIAAYPQSFLTGVSPVGIENVASQPYAKSVLYQTGAEPATLFFKLDSKKILGRRGPLSPEINGAEIGSNPTDFVQLSICIQSSLATAVTNNCVLSVEIVQDVWFDQRNVKSDVA